MTFGSTSLHAQPGTGRMERVLPPTPAGREVEALVRAFADSSFTDPRWIRWRQLVGPVSFQAAEMLPNDGIRAWVKGTISRAWLGWEVVPDKQGVIDRSRVAVFWLGASPPPALRAATRFSQSDSNAAAAIDAYLRAAANADLFSGVVVVAHRGRPILERAFGFANRERGEPNTTQTRFSMASVGKVFTAAAIARLVADGRLSYDDRVGKFLPDYPIVAARSATVGQLLAHQSGVGSTSFDWIATREPLTLTELLARTAAPQQFEPGTKTQYSNEGYLIAGRIVEIASGMPYESFVKRQVFARAGMTETDWDAIDAPPRRRAVPYSNLRFVAGGGQVFEPGTRRDVTSMHGRKGTPAGGAFTTAADLLRFASALLDGRLVDDTARATLFAPRGRRPGGATSYGFELETAPLVVRKGGNAQGTSAQLDIYPDEGWVFVVLSNYDQSAQVIAHGIRDILSGGS